MAMSFLGLGVGKICEGPWADDELEDAGTMARMIDSFVPFPVQDVKGGTGVEDTG